MGNVLLMVIEAILVVTAIVYIFQKKFFVSALVLCTGALFFLVVSSITGEEEFNQTVKDRENVVKERLGQIRIAEEAYKESHGDEYADSFEQLIDFIKNGRVYEVNKVGVLDEHLQQEGWNDSSAAAKIYEIKMQHAGDEAAIAAAIEAIFPEANGGFRIDTIWKPATTLFEGVKDFCVDSLPNIPFSGGEKFELYAALDSTRSGMKVHIMQCAAPDASFLKGLGVKGKRVMQDRQELAESRNTFAGLKIGSETADEWNNNGGNWDE